ncbi:adenylosuccinate synthase [Patescibacteria group bacterium]|nr:adenylosuccinate synthase [Patescibacteria group bacterium]MBU4480726.1 adenylosuccinate synthase [Patescibacteria group bacterium]
MPTTVIIGTQWGDEGKGKVVDYLSQKMDFVVRFNGGPNAGHTVINDYGEFKLHLVSAGIFNQKAISIIGNGVAIDPEILNEEIENLRGKAVSCQNLKVSDKAHLILPWHILLDGLQEKERGTNEIGTTKRGIGPVFSDKVGRFGLRAGDFLDEKELSEKLFLSYNRAKNLLGGKFNFSFDAILKKILSHRSNLLSYIVQTESILWEAISDKKKILLEGAQGALLDVDFGTYPDVTSSACISASACQGSGIPPKELNEIIGVVKAYTTRVGAKEQPFPTEMPPELASELREKANEYGATTGRPRRCGWLDGFLLRYAAKINGFTSLAITRLDSLTGFEKLKICSGYKTKEGKTISLAELSLSQLKGVQPIYLELPGWKEFSKDCKRFSDLPKETQRYLNKIEELVEVPIKLISFGPERKKMLEV